MQSIIDFKTQIIATHYATEDPGNDYNNGWTDWKDIENKRSVSAIIEEILGAEREKETN